MQSNDIERTAGSDSSPLLARTVPEIASIARFIYGESSAIEDAKSLSGNAKSSLPMQRVLNQRDQFTFRCGQPPSTEELSIARGVWSLEQ